MVKTVRKNSSGFTLLEVLIAMTIFATFITAFVAVQGNNLRDSTTMREEQILQRLCENKLSEITLHPPAFSESLTLTPETKTFEEYPDYQYTVTYKRLEIPEYNQVQGLDPNEEQQDQNRMLEKKVYDQVAKIVKEALWQVEVLVENKQTKYQFELSTWLRNRAAKVEITP